MPSSTPLPQGDVTARVAKRMRVERARRGMSQEQLSRALANAGLAMPRTQLAELELGRKREASVDLLWALSRVFVVPAAELLGLPRCAACSGQPPVGFSCNACGAGRSR